MSATPMTFAWGSLAPKQRPKKSSSKLEHSYKMNSSWNSPKPRRSSPTQGAKLLGSWGMRSRQSRMIRNSMQMENATSTEGSDSKYHMTYFKRNVNDTRRTEK